MIVLQIGILFMDIIGVIFKTHMKITTCFKGKISVIVVKYGIY